MGYTRSYREYVHVHYTQSVSISYPASQSGGTRTGYATIDEQIPIDIAIHVDTDPFDNSVSNHANNVDFLTGAVVGMKTSQLESIRNNSNRISESISKGFYRLIGSEISTQMSENKSELQSKAALVFELAKDIQQKHSRMADDVNRLKRHYKQVFDTLDEDCRKRVLALDKAAFILSNARTKLIKNPYITEGAFSLYETKDTANTSNMSVIARLRNQVSKVIAVMTGSAMKTQQYLRDVENYSENIQVSDNTVSYLPVVFSESKNLSDESISTSVLCSGNASNRDQIMNTVEQYVTAVNADSFKDVDEYENKMIEQNFLSIAQESLGTDFSEEQQRVHDLIMKMWKDNKVKTL